MGEDDTPKKDESNFNSSIDCLKRINGIIHKCNHFSTLAKLPDENNPYLKVSPTNLTAWHLNLKNFYKEITPEITPKEKENLIKLWSKQLPRLCIKKDTPSGKITIINLRSFNLRWHHYYTIDQQLRILASIHGLLITKKPKGLDAADT